MYELLDAAGATLCDPLLIILLAVMMMPSGGGSSYVFSGKSPREKKPHSLFSQFPSTRFAALYSLSKPDEPWEGRNASLVCNNMPYLPFL